jgi:hypothetical protein
MVGAKRLDKKWLAASKEIKAQQGSKGFLGTHSFLKYPFHGAQCKQHRRPFSACGVGDTSTFHLCKIVPVVGSIQGRIFIRSIRSTFAVRSNRTMLLDRLINGAFW